MARERFQFRDISTRDGFFRQLDGFGYNVTKYRPGDICSGRIVAADGTTVHYEAGPGEMVILLNDGSDIPDSVVALAHSNGGSSF